MKRKWHTCISCLSQCLEKSGEKTLIPLCTRSYFKTSFHDFFSQDFLGSLNIPVKKSPRTKSILWYQTSARTKGLLTTTIFLCPPLVTFHMWNLDSYARPVGTVFVHDEILHSLDVYHPDTRADHLYDAPCHRAGQGREQQRTSAWVGTVPDEFSVDLRFAITSMEKCFVVACNLSKHFAHVHQLGRPFCFSHSSCICSVYLGCWDRVCMPTHTHLGNRLWCCASVHVYLCFLTQTRSSKSSPNSRHRSLRNLKEILVTCRPNNLENLRLIRVGYSTTSVEEPSKDFFLSLSYKPSHSWVNTLHQSSRHPVSSSLSFSSRTPTSTHKTHWSRSARLPGPAHTVEYEIDRSVRPVQLLTQVIDEHSHGVTAGVLKWVLISERGFTTCPFGS